MISSIVVLYWSNYHILFDEYVKGQLKISSQATKYATKLYIYLFINSYFIRTRLYELNDSKILNIG